MKRAVAIAIAIVACGRSEAPPRRAPPAGHAPVDPRLPLAIVVPADSVEYGANKTTVELAPRDASEAWLRTWLAMGRVKRLRSVTKLADGWLAMIARDDGDDEPVIYRTIGDHGYVCWPFGDDAAERDLTRAECLAMREEGAGVLVPFAMSEHTTLSVGRSIGASLGIEPATAQTPADPYAAQRDYPGSTMLAHGAMPGGYYLLVHWPDKNPQFPLAYVAVVRTTVGGRDLVCTASNEDEASVRAWLDVCRSLRTP